MNSWRKANGFTLVYGTRIKFSNGGVQPSGWFFDDIDYSIS